MRHYGRLSMGAVEVLSGSEWEKKGYRGGKRSRTISPNDAGNDGCVKPGWDIPPRAIEYYLLNKWYRRLYQSSLFPKEKWYQSPLVEILFALPLADLIFMFLIILCLGQATQNVTVTSQMMPDKTPWVWNIPTEIRKIRSNNNENAAPLSSRQLAIQCRLFRRRWDDQT
jgi:hypothetical protein